MRQATGYDDQESVVVHRVGQYSEQLQDAWLECQPLRRRWEGTLVATSDPVDCMACLSAPYRE